MAVGPSCFVRRETRGLNERLRKGLDCERVWEAFFCFSLFLSPFFFLLCERYVVIISRNNLEEVVGVRIRFRGCQVQCQRLIFAQIIFDRFL